MIYKILCLASFVFIIGTIGSFEFYDGVQQQMSFLECGIRLAVGLIVLIFTGKKGGLFDE